jgi:hypothetical protein
MSIKLGLSFFLVSIIFLGAIWQANSTIKTMHNENSYLLNTIEAQKSLLQRVQYR